MQGVQGLRGVPGPIGGVGPRGENGSSGPQGERGLTGLQGQKGDTGSQGSQGIQGPIGERGVTGLQGLPGKDGKDAIIPVDISSNSIKANKVCIKSWCFEEKADGKLYLSKDARTVVRYATVNNLFVTYAGLNEKGPYFSVNNDGSSYTHTGQDIAT